MVTASAKCAVTDACVSSPYMTLVVSSYRASLAPGTFLLHSGDSLNASSALQLLDTRMPDHDVGVGVAVCARSEEVAMQRNIATHQDSFIAFELAQIDTITLWPSFLPLEFGAPGAPGPALSLSKGSRPFFGC